MSRSLDSLASRALATPALAIALLAQRTDARQESRPADPDLLREALERIERLEEEIGARRAGKETTSRPSPEEAAREPGSPPPTDGAGGYAGPIGSLARLFGPREPDAARLSLLQGPAFQTPGTPRYPAQSAPAGETGQTGRFSSVFNPALSFVVDTVGDYRHARGGDRGFDAELRAVELVGQSWVDPDAWAYFVAATDGESVALEEGAVHFVGLGGHTTVRAGRFFVDFGKQMQIHAHELRTIERPLVLRTYLGDEIRGDGLQFDHWFPVGASTAVRWSLAGFSSLLPEEEEDFDRATSASISVADRKSLGDLNTTARVTGFGDLGDSGTLQLGASARRIPNFTLEFEPSGASESHLSNTVYGADATYGWVDETGLRRWTAGGEYLLNAGDNGAEIDEAGTPGVPADDTITVFHRRVGGYFAFADVQWDAWNSAGLQYSALHRPDASRSDATEIEAYYTHLFSEFHRVRLAVASFRSDDAAEDAWRVAVQYTATLGAHGHGVNW